MVQILLKEIFYNWKKTIKNKNHQETNFKVSYIIEKKKDKKFIDFKKYCYLRILTDKVYNLHLLKIQL